MSPYDDSRFCEQCGCAGAYVYGICADCLEEEMGDQKTDEVMEDLDELAE